MMNEFERFSDMTLKSLRKDELIEHIRLLQENLQMLDIQCKRTIEANIKLSECIPEEKRKEIQKELFEKWEDDEKHE